MFFRSWVYFWSFGGVFVRFLVVLEWSEGCFGRSFGGLEGSWALFRGVLGRLEGVLGSLGTVLAAHEAINGSFWDATC